MSFSVTAADTSCPEVFCKKGALKIFAKLTGKHLYRSHFFNKVEGFQPATLLEKTLVHLLQVSLVKSLILFIL